MYTPVLGKRSVCFLNLSHPNISMHILHTVLYTLPMLMTRRICLTSNSYSRDVNVEFIDGILGGELDAGHA